MCGLPLLTSTDILPVAFVLYTLQEGCATSEYYACFTLLEHLQGCGHIGSDFMQADVHTAEEAIALIDLAKAHSSNWTTDAAGSLQPMPNKAHLFVRIAYTDLDRQQGSTLHVVDLAGSQNLSSHHSHEQQHQEKLITNRQLLSFSNVVTELSRLSSSQGNAAAAQYRRADPQEGLSLSCKQCPRNPICKCVKG